VNIGQTFLHDTKNRGFHFLGQAAQVRRHIEFDSRGDVIDIGLLRTTLMETGNWVSKDLYNGRIVRIPNNIVLKVPVFNYSQGFVFVWEIKVLFTTATDCQFAREMLLRAAKEAIASRRLRPRSTRTHHLLPTARAARQVPINMLWLTTSPWNTTYLDV